MNPNVYIQILPENLLVQAKGEFWTGRFTRSENGRLTAASREELARDLKAFLQRKGVKEGEQAAVALPARGVTLRLLEIPRAPRSEIEGILRFQIESEFPVPPSELAWSWKTTADNSNPQTQKVLITALKLDLVQEWQQLFSSAGLTLIWTLAAFARAQLIPAATLHFAQLHIEEKYSELLIVENGTPGVLRSLNWGAAQLQSAVEQKLNLSPTEASQALKEWCEGKFSRSDLQVECVEAIQSEARKLAGMVSGMVRATTLFVSGSPALLPGFLEGLKRGAETQVEPLQPGRIHGGEESATADGMDFSFTGGKAKITVLQHGLDARATEEKRKVLEVSAWKWPAVAAALLILAVAMRHLEVLVHKPRLAKRIEEIKRYQKNLPSVDTEIEFLQFVQTNQPPYLDAIHALASSTAPGTKLENLTMNRRGDLSIKATMQNAQQATDLRAKLYDSKLFSSVTLEEQTPSPDGQRLTIRLGAQLKNFQETREALAAANAATASTNTLSQTNNKPVKVVAK